MMELKEYQRGALDALARWLETLEETQRELETMVEMFRQAPTDLARGPTADGATPGPVPKFRDLPARSPT